jgi:rhamnosyltransferase
MTPQSQMPKARFDRADIAVAVVLYHPSDSDLDNVTELATWGVNVVAVVNAISETQRRKLPSGPGVSGPGVSVIVNSSNLGLARALNQAVGAAIDAGAHFVLMLDQDSRPTVDMLDRLAGAAIAIEAKGRPLACVAPLLRDRKAVTDDKGETVDTVTGVTFATSGTMLTRRAWQEVGPMWEPLFIDGIDHEWCFRARAAGFETVLVPSAVMTHDMGEAAINVMGRFRPVHRSPVRHYFIVRNTLWLVGKRHIPIRWRLSELAKLAYRVPSYVVFSTDKIRTARNITAAIVDGVGRTSRRQPV